MKNLTFFLLLMIFACSACQPAPDVNVAAPASPEAYNPNTYRLFDIPGSDLKRAERQDSTGALVESGILDGSIKTGTWVTYHTSTGMPWKTISFANGKYNGPYFEYTLRGQVNLIANYKDNQLHGFWGKYYFSRPEILANYNEGKLDGIYRKYFPNKNDAIQEEVNYVNGIIDGKYRFYNEDGLITLEYDYKNGKKVGGGIVNQ